MSDVKLERNGVSIDGTLRVNGNGLHMGSPENLRITSGGSTTSVTVGSTQKPARVQLKGHGNEAFLFVAGLMRCAEVDTGKLSVDGTDLAAKIAELERRLAALEG